MATALTYDDYVNQIATMAIIPSDDPNYLTIIPQMISYAEDRIQRDLDFLASQTTMVYSGAVQLGASDVGVPLSDFISIQTVQISPIVVDPQINTPYYSLLPVGKEFIQNVYGYNQVDNRGTPQYFAMNGAYSGTNPTYWQILFGPTADNNYDLTVTGTLRFAPISSDNTTTFISTYLPELFIMASMIYISAYQRNFGRESDDPQMAQSYENQYQLLLKGATIEEFRKKFQSSAWAPYSPSPVATPTRG